MAESRAPDAPPIPVGTAITLAPGVRFLGRDYVTGGAPWRLLRLAGATRTVIERWGTGDVVRAGEERLARTLVRQGLAHTALSPEHGPDDVDVVVPAHGDAAALDRLLGSLAGLRVTVVDDGSGDDEIARVGAAHGANVLRRPTNEGPAAARNTGAAATRGALLWFLDADVEVRDAGAVLARLRAALGDPTVAAAAPRVRGPRARGARAGFEHRHGALDLGPHSALVVPHGTVAYVPSACLLVRRDAFDLGFDPALRVGEDVDLVWRLHDRGWQVRYLAEVVVTHPARASWAAWWAQRVGYGRSSGELSRRHGSRLAPLRADVVTLAAWAGVLSRVPRLGARVMRLVRDDLARRLDDDEPENAGVADALARRAVLGAGGPLARALTRTYLPGLVVCVAVPRLRRRALGVIGVGVLWRLRGRRSRPLDVPLALADDLAYSLGVAQGSWRARTWAPLRPVLTTPAGGLRALVGRRPTPLS